jgi:hypothetical protein
MIRVGSLNRFRTKRILYRPVPGLETELLRLLLHQLVPLPTLAWDPPPALFLGSGVSLRRPRGRVEWFSRAQTVVIREMVGDVREDLARAQNRGTPKTLTKRLVIEPS